MRKLSVLVFALVACIAVGAVTMATAKTKVKTKVSVNFSGTTSGGGIYTPVTFKGDFSGKVKGKKGCKKRRKVTISPGIGSMKSNSNGQYDIPLTAKPAAGNYTVKVKKKKIRTHGKKIICKKAKATVKVG
jgi:hypothetical protein